MSALVAVTPPVGEPITLTEVKAWCRVTGDQDDGVLAALITTARQSFDGRDAWFGRALLNQTWDYNLDCFPQCGVIYVPLPPLQSVASVKYLDTSGVQQTLPPVNYFVDVGALPGRITPTYGTTWPSARFAPNAVTVRFTAGYGPNPQTVPMEIRVWLRQLVAYLFENRQATTVPDAFFWTLAKYKVDWQF